jgi:hypothetical protein
MDIDIDIIEMDEKSSSDQVQRSKKEKKKKKSLFEKCRKYSFDSSAQNSSIIPLTLKESSTKFKIPLNVPAASTTATTTAITDEKESKYHYYNENMSVTNSMLNFDNSAQKFRRSFEEQSTTNNTYYSGCNFLDKVVDIDSTSYEDLFANIPVDYDFDLSYIKFLSTKRHEGISLSPESMQKSNENFFNFSYNPPES